MPLEDHAAEREALLRDTFGMTRSQLKAVRSMVNAFKTPITYTAASDSDIVGEPFIETMANFLAVHHALHEEPLNKKPFEYIYKQCLIAQGFEANLNSTPGLHPYDVIGAGTRWSLKTEAAKGISSNQVKIEKLMEARWIRDCTTPEACCDALKLRLPRHLSGYDRIMVLRAFIGADGLRYVLEEVPIKTLTACIELATPEMFSKNKKSPSFGADFYLPNHDARAFRILFDSSVEKVRLWYARDFCIHHGTWAMSAPKSPVPDDHTNASCVGSES
ncbi:hypothetical protein [Actinocatenispora rupis]|nr:hypothetical protein [Actinocatenispora rupis]